MFRDTLLAAALASLVAPMAWAAVGADEAKQLGVTLTAVGAEKAGNKEGTIPEYTGGLTTPPPGFQKDSGFRPDPFASEKPRLTITGKDVAAHADKLTEGTKELLKRYPTMRVDVYPTHRTVALPKFVVDNTVKNATVAKAIDGGLATQGVLPGFPFPIPKTGYEVMWNHLLAYKGLGFYAQFDSINVNAAGVPRLATYGDATYEWPNYDPKKTGFIKETDPFWNVKIDYLGPPRRKGEALLVQDSANPLKQARRAWQYLPGQRRVKAAPEVAYDEPNAVWAGAAAYSDAEIFNGAMDRFDFKLLGKKEMYVPYNAYRLAYEKTTANITKPKHINPDLVRWELHRVWVVEARLKPDKHDIYSKRVFYVDEDSWLALASDEYDGEGQLYRSAFAFLSQSYDVPAPWFDTQAYYDFSSRLYNVTGLVGGYSGIKYLNERKPESFWSPEALAGAGSR